MFLLYISKGKLNVRIASQQSAQATASKMTIRLNHTSLKLD